MKVGRFASTQALAAVGSTGSLSFLIIDIATGLWGAFGAKDEGKLRQYIANSFWLGAGLSLLLAAIARGLGDGGVSLGHVLAQLFSGLGQFTYMKELGMGSDRYILVDVDKGDAIILSKDAVKGVGPAAGLLV